MPWWSVRCNNLASADNAPRVISLALRSSRVCHALLLFTPCTLRVGLSLQQLFHADV